MKFFLIPELPRDPPLDRGPPDLPRRHLLLHPARDHGRGGRRRRRPRGHGQHVPPAVRQRRVLHVRLLHGGKGGGAQGRAAAGPDDVERVILCQGKK